MDPQYDEYFRGRLARAFGAPFSREALYTNPDLTLRTTATAVGAAEAAVPSGFVLRSDAELLLYLLASELVVQPVLSTLPPGDLGYAGTAAELSEDLRRDAAQLIRTASRRQLAGGEISAHAIIDALSASWSDLRVANWRVWDRRGR